MTQGQCQTTRKSHIFDILFDLISKLFSCIPIVINIYWNDKMTVSVLTMSRISNNNKKLANPDTKKVIFNLKLIFMKILRKKIYWGANQSVQKLRKFFFELLNFFLATTGHPMSWNYYHSTQNRKLYQTVEADFF